MITLCYTSPTDQAVGTIDIALQFGEHSEAELSMIGEATRLVMEAALDTPEQEPQRWARHALGVMGIISPDMQARVEKKAQHARNLMDFRVLISDEELASQTIDNNFVRPNKRGC